VATRSAAVNEGLSHNGRGGVSGRAVVVMDGWGGRASAAAAAMNGAGEW